MPLTEPSEEERGRRWREHCLRIAEATYALADWCDDHEMMGAYVELAAKWLNMSEGDPPASEAR